MNKKQAIIKLIVCKKFMKPVFKLRAAYSGVAKFFCSLKIPVFSTDPKSLETEFNNFQNDFIKNSRNPEHNQSVINYICTNSALYPYVNKELKEKLEKYIFDNKKIMTFDNLLVCTVFSKSTNMGKNFKESADYLLNETLERLDKENLTLSQLDAFLNVFQNEGQRLPPEILTKFYLLCQNSLDCENINLIVKVSDILINETLDPASKNVSSNLSIVLEYVKKLGLYIRDMNIVSVSKFAQIANNLDLRNNYILQIEERYCQLLYLINDTGLSTLSIGLGAINSNNPYLWNLITDIFLKACKEMTPQSAGITLLGIATNNMNNRIVFETVVQHFKVKINKFSANELQNFVVAFGLNSYNDAEMNGAFEKQLTLIFEKDYSNQLLIDVIRSGLIWSAHFVSLVQNLVEKNIKNMHIGEKLSLAHALQQANWKIESIQNDLEEVEEDLEELQKLNNDNYSS